jgi:hypothetical protein
MTQGPERGQIMTMHLESFHELSVRQMGTYSRQQLTGIGWTAAAIRHRLEVGSWVIIHPGVYGLAGHADSWHRRLWAAHLHAGPDSILCANTSGRLHGASQAYADRVELMVDGNKGAAPPGVRWFRRIDVADNDISTMDGLPPLTSPARTVVDLAGQMSVIRLRFLIEELVAQKRTSVAAVGVVLSRVRRSGKPGVRKLTRVLDELGPGDTIARSKLEHLGDDLIALAGLPTPVHEHPLPNSVGRVGFVDRCWPSAKLIVEFDGRKWHDRSQQQLQDADRRMEAAAEGYLTQAVLWEHATSARDRCAEILHKVHAERIALLR